MIKRSRIPIICICNDRQSQKIRSLAGHCFDLRFQRPRAEQIKVLAFGFIWKMFKKLRKQELKSK